MFDLLNLAAVRPIATWTENGSAEQRSWGQIIDGTALCVHGGLSPDIRTLDQIRVISRAQEIPHEGAFCGIYMSSLVPQFTLYDRVMPTLSSPTQISCGQIPTKWKAGP